MRRPEPEHTRLVFVRAGTRPASANAIASPRRRKSITAVGLEEFPEDVDRRAAEDDLEHDAGDTHDEPDDDDDDVLEQHA